MGQKPRLSFWQIWNMSFGFLGIQFGWGLQMANMSSIYESLGAKPDEIPMLWLAAPLTGLLVQPIIGYLSDRTWHPTFGRRKPYFLVGAILASIALFFMPNSSSIWMAAGLLWILDASINVSMEPFRAFVADMLPEEQHTQGYTMQSVFIGLGSVIASALPFIFTNLFHLESDAVSGGIPMSVKLSFYIGAFAFLGAVVYTVMTTKEYPPKESEMPQKPKEGFLNSVILGASEIFESITNMPNTMRQLALVQFFTWPGLFLMWFYFGVGITRTVFGFDDSLSKYQPYHAFLSETMKADPMMAGELAYIMEKAPIGAEEQRVTVAEVEQKFGDIGKFNLAMRENEQKRSDGNEWGGMCFAFYSLVTFFFAFALPSISDKFGKKMTHIICLTCGALGLLSVGIMTDKYMLLFSMLGVGIAWSSILSMPYAMLASCVPAEKTGIFMGIFNFFIVIPEIMATLGFGWIMKNVLNNNHISAVMLGGGLLLVAAVLTFLVKEEKAEA